jgi:subtilase family serine protease
MTIRFNMTTAQQAALDQLLVDLQNPASPRYRQWLTPAQFGAQFGLSSADIAQVTAWLTSQGFTVTGVANGGTFVTFDGTVAQANAAFSTSIHNLSVGGETHFANVANPSVPGAFAGVVGAVTGLHDFHPKPRVRANAVKPQFFSSVSGSHYLAPGDIYTIYDVSPLLTGGTNGAGIGTGANCHSVPAGTTCGDIAVTGAVDLYNTGNTTSPVYADVVAFRAASGLSTTILPTTVHEGADPGSPRTCANCFPNDSDLEEASLDVEWSGAMAPSAAILFVNGPDIFNNAMTQAIDQDLAPIVTTSYGFCEAGEGTTEINTLNQLFKQANAQGQTVLAAAADQGATDCDAGTSAIEGLAVDFPASSPYVTGMGGTMFNQSSAYWGSTNNLNSGSAVSYIPESVWDEDSTGNTFSAGGGGPSTFFTKPAWQVETGPAGMTSLVPADASRDVPDLSLDAAANPTDSPYLLCFLGSCVSGYREANSDLTVAGGTSFDSQIFGGMLALIEQKVGSRIGNANPTIYALGNSATYYNGTSNSVFHDVTTGNNDNPCTAGTIDCPNGGTIGFSAGVGYDLATGWGSVDLFNLASDWTKVTPLGIGSLGPGISSTALTPSVASIAAGSSVTFMATVTGQNVTSESPLVTTAGTATPTGTVQFLVNNTIVGTSPLNGSGVATYTYTTSCATLGQGLLDATASYSGDSNYAGSKGPTLDALGAGVGGYPQSSNGTVELSPLLVTVTAGTCPDFTVTPASASISVAAGGTIPGATITVAPLNGFAGTVVFSASVTSTSGYLPNLLFSNTSITLPATTTTTTLTLTGITADLRMPNLPGQTEPGTLDAGKTPWYAVGSGVTIASLLLLILPRKRRLGGLLVLVLSVAIAFGATGCGSKTATTTTTPPTSIYAGTYVVTITGSSTISGVETSNSTTVTFNIN